MERAVEGAVEVLIEAGLITGEEDVMPAGDDLIRTGLAEIDDALGGGLRRGSLTVIAGHGGAGAAMLARQIAGHAAAEQGLTAGYLAVGSRAADVQREAIAGQTGVRVTEIHHDTAAERRAAVERVFDGRLTIRQTDVRTREAVLERAIHSLQVDEDDLLVIDCLNLIGVVDDDWRFPLSPPLASDEMADLLRHLRVLALDADRVIIVVADLPIMGTGEYPNSADHSMAHRAALGPAAQLADSLLLLYRPDLWDANDPRSGETDVVVARGPHRHVPTTVTFAHQLHLARFVSFR
ncbi:hypothetical protein MUG78_16090 [Gordonia alkaliphila]|uniref:SF4 helicase domain-containing protein n=1 Tax=Gordonia alkaliphila TaxID=1053547 RepID=A0ABP8Z5N6_9ACTN|nr:DnaB-like helicase C-terminal domain-containing protein [Gordonia alkaliphila]MCK0440931.1 hypothetical protein [Gordonia alkaliphila]